MGSQKVLLYPGCPYGGFHGHEGTHGWFVMGKSHLEIDDLGVLWGTPILGNPHMIQMVFRHVSTYVSCSDQDELVE